MKNLIFPTILFFLFAGTTIKAQDSVAVDKPSFHVVELGIRAMPTFSAFDMQTSSGGTVEGEVTLGYGIGGMLGINFTKHFGIQGEVIYNSLSQKYKDDVLDREINIRYINIPLLFSLSTDNSSPVLLKVVFGPQLGYNVGSSIKSSGDSSVDTVTTVLAVRQSDFGLAYGAGLGFALNELGTIRFDLGFRGVYGFVNVSNTSNDAGANTYYILDRAVIKTYSGYFGFTLLF